MAEMTVASTTDTQKDIDRAAGIVSKADEQPNVAVVEPDTPAQEPEQREQEGERKPAKSAFQKRIDKLTRERYEDRQRIEDLTKRLEAMGGEKPQDGTPAAVAEKPPERAPRPTAEDKKADGSLKYATYDDLAEAIADWKVEEKLAQKFEEMQAAEAAEAAQSAEQAIFTAYQEKLEEAKERYDDFEEVVGRKNIQIPEAVQLAIIQFDNGPDVAYYLGQHPEVCKRLCELNDQRKLLLAIGEVGAISNSLHPVEASTEEEPPAAPTHRPASKAVAPIKPVSGSSTKSSVPLDELPYSEFKRLRNQQLKNRYR